MSKDLFAINGLDATAGGYLLPPLPADVIAAVALDEQKRIDATYLAELRDRQDRKEAHYGVRAGVETRNLSQAGWGVIFAHNAEPALKEALSELLGWRREQAGERYREYDSYRGYRPDDTKDAFLTRNGSAPGPVDPKKMPYYLLIVGDPEAIPYEFQYQLDVAHAVGRIHFDALEEYAQYAHSVVTAEKNRLALPRRAAFFGVQNQHDAATDLSAGKLVAPLAEWMQGEYEQQNWSVEAVLGGAATKARLTQLLGGAETPALLFTASHGAGFHPDDPRQLPHQGALVCQDWPGPREWKGRIPQDFYFAGDDVTGDALVFGLIAFHFACYGAGTPMLDDFPYKHELVQQAIAAGQKPERSAIAPHAFVAGLPKRLLSHPKGGALAVIGHVERAWPSSFIWGKEAHRTVFESLLQRLCEGYPVGAALEDFNQRYAELSAALSSEINKVNWAKTLGKTLDPTRLAEMWTANHDARGYAIIGDPAVHLCIGDSALAGLRPALEPVSLPLKGKSGPDAAGQPGGADATSAARRDPPDSPLDTSDVSYAAGDAAKAAGQIESLAQVAASLAEALQRFAGKLSQGLERLADHEASLHVATYVSDSLSEVAYDQGQFTGSVRKVAVSRVHFDGGIELCMAQQGEQADRVALTVHEALVERAQANRAEMLKAAAAAAAELWRVAGSG